MSIFDIVKQLANEQKISISELERKLGMGRNSLYRWKTQTPSSDTLQKVADYFNVSIDYLLGRTSEKYINSQQNLEDDEPEIRILQRAAQEMSPEQRKKALRLWQVAFDELFDDKK